MGRQRDEEEQDKGKQGRRERRRKDRQMTNTSFSKADIHVLILWYCHGTTDHVDQPCIGNGIHGDGLLVVPIPVALCEMQSFPHSPQPPAAVHPNQTANHMTVT